jgi:thiol-disulfide isomerase/thioredoxin
MKLAPLKKLATLLSIAILAIACCPSLAAQSGDTPAGSASTPSKKPKRVWTEDDLQQLSGGVSVVGQASEDKGAEQRPSGAAPPAAPLTRYKLDFRAKTLDGYTYTDDFAKGKVTLVQFWATWCPHCQNDQPAVDRIFSDTPGDRLLILAVNTKEPEGVVRKYLARSPRACPVVLGKDTDLNSLRSSEGVPFYVLLDRNGNVVASHDGELGLTGMRRMLQKTGL